MVNLRWQDNTPISQDFDDIYYSPEDGTAEARYVFIGGNGLVERWKKASCIQKEPDLSSFVICELGFGSGLNFYLSCADFLEYAPAKLKLHYIACEKYPLSSRQIARAMQAFLTKAFLPSIKSSLDEFLAQYREVQDSQDLYIHKERVRLSLYFSDAYAMCRELEKKGQKIDAWFLDGFAPSKNPEMWKPEIFYSMACMAREGTSFATFSAAGKIRRGLQEAGFQTQRLNGFGSKRHMLRGHWV